MESNGDPVGFKNGCIRQADGSVQEAQRYGKRTKAVEFAPYGQDLQFPFARIQLLPPPGQKLKQHTNLRLRLASRDLRRAFPLFAQVAVYVKSLVNKLKGDGRWFYKLISKNSFFFYKFSFLFSSKIA